MDTELGDGFKYHYNKDEVDAKFITISAFTMKQMHLVAPVKEIYMKSLGKLVAGVELTPAEIEAAKAEAEAKAKAGIEEDKGHSGIMTIIAMNCQDGDLAKLYGYMKQLLTSGVAYIDASDVKFNGTYIEMVTPADFEKLCGEYIGNFIT